MSRDIVFVYDHYYPDWSAGGPVTSLANLAQLLGNVKILTSAYYYDTGKKIDRELNKWNDNVWYSEKASDVVKALDTLKQNSTIYLNGIFSPVYFLEVLREAKKRKFDVVISPRGMLQEGALRNKSFKKKVYLLYLKALGVAKDVTWHATDEQEQADIKREFSGATVQVVPNVPRPPVLTNTSIPKRSGELRLVYFSLIARKKNLKFIVELLQTPSFKKITLDIIGPIKDPDYWIEILPLIKDSQVIRYVGDCAPAEVNTILSKYHLFVLPTQGENFGHAILEALSSYRPVLISDQTPWKAFGVPLDKTVWESKLSEALSWDQKQFDQACTAAMEYYKEKIDLGAMRAKYQTLFKINS